jgi:hypothetical protein
MRERWSELWFEMKVGYLQMEGVVKSGGIRRLAA